MRRRSAPAAVTLLIAAALLATTAVPAHATGYRYWSYWLRSGGVWTYARTGPALHTPKDGDVEGWRFAISRDAADAATRPRAAAELGGDARAGTAADIVADFAAICAGTPSTAGRKRIALVIDSGTAADAPGGQVPPGIRVACARVPPGASSADALAAVARPLRYDSSGILCAIGGYPRTGCGEQVAGGGGGTERAAAGPGAGGGSDGGSGPSAGVFAGVAVVVALGGAAGWRARRRRS
jgi:hypothetical protein